jgi:metal-responsive CopG/Arc/MetJ family transcriptional regulator
VKTAVSIPDRIFRAAEQLAARWRISRSQLYAKALDALVEKHNDQVVTARLNEVYGPEGEDSSLDPVLAELQQRTLKRNR